MGRILQIGRTAAAVAALSALAACTVGPDFQRPAPPSPQAYAAPAAPVGGSAAGEPAQRIAPAPPPAAWWRAFKAPEIDAAVDAALAGNPDVAAARARLAQAREAAVRAGAGLYPSVDLGVAVSRYTASFLPQGVDERGGLTNDYLIGPNVSFAADIFGGGRRLREQRRAQAEAAAFELQAARLTVGGAVVRTAVEAARLRDQLAAVDQLIADDRATVAALDRLVEARRRTIADLEAARSQLAQDEALAPPLRRQLAASSTALAVLAGRTPDAAPAATIGLEAIALPSELPLSLPAELVRRRPDVRAAEAQLHAASAAIGVAAARQLPSLTLTGSITQETLSASRLFDSSATGGVVSANLAAPLFHAGALRSQKREAVAAYDEAAARYRHTVLGAVGQVADVLQALRHDADAATDEAAGTASAGRAADAAQRQFEAGRIDTLLLLKTREDLGRARMRLAAARAQRLLDTVQLYVALGGGEPG